MKKLKIIIMFVLVAVLSQSCATMFSGTSYTANIHASKPGSEIYVDGKLEGVDDVSMRIKRKKEPVIEIKNAGETTEFELMRTIKWGSQVANLLNWMYFIPVGSIIDLANGAIWQPEHKDIPEVEKINNKTFNIIINNSDDDD